jgi:hypothetical protein
MSQTLISFRCRLHALAVTKFLLMISRLVVTQVLVTIFGSTVKQFSLTITCVSHDSVFADDSMCKP